ncbi:protease-like protein, partial [Azospirillum formosense]|nr:protease-like protein [Azospirillum formosense]
LIGGAGNNLLDGGDGFDTVVFEEGPSSYTIRHSGAGEVVVEGPRGTNTLRSIEHLSFGDLTLALSRDATPGTVASTFFGVANSASGTQILQEASTYSGPVQTLQWQLIGSDDGEAIVGGVGNDFINSRGGMDAIDGGAGDDVLDGGTGSNFLTGGSGHDTFFLDGRSGEPVWSTVTDLEAGEIVTVWGWQPGQSAITWAEVGGAGGFTGATAHIDLDGDGRTDASLTLSGKSVGALTAMPGTVNGTDYLAIWLNG